MNLNNNSIQNIEYFVECINLKKLYLENNFITKIDGLGNLVNLTFLNIENNKIDPQLYQLLKLTDNNPRLFVSYCILRQLIEKMERKIKWPNLIEKIPYLKGLNYDQLRNITLNFKYVEVQIDNNYNIQTIITPEELVEEFDNLIKIFRNMKI